jgi:hypothetical protein
MIINAEKQESKRDTKRDSDPEQIRTRPNIPVQPH